MKTEDVFRRWLVSEMKAGRMDRREFLSRLAMLGLSAAGSALPGFAFAEETPKPGGHMRFAMAHGEAADTLDPAHVNNGYTTGA